MSTSVINVFCTKRGTCDITSETLFVYVTDCRGRILEWCGKRYVNIPARCGHATIEVPPGCYFVGAVENPKGIKPLGNHLTHLGVVQVRCGDHACVTLFDPTLHFCGTWFKNAVTTHLQAQALPATAQGTAREAVRAVENLLGAIEPDAFAQQLEKELGPRPTDTGGAKKAGRASKKGGRKG